MILDIIVLAVWLSPICYFIMALVGKIANCVRRRKLSKNSHRIDKIILQIPTVGNYETVNQIVKTVKSYNLPVEVESWVIIEEDDENRDKYIADRVIVVPKDFECEDLYKARALEYARRLRKIMVDEKLLPEKYLLLQCDDDSVPSESYIRECLNMDAHIIIASIHPRPRGVLGTVLDYERCVACTVMCNFFTNIGEPVWAHGEGMCIDSSVDLNVSYDVSDVNGSRSVKLISSEDLFYLHKAVLRGYTKIYNSENPTYITPPLTVSDAVKQRRRWIWGHIRIMKDKLLPLSNRVRIALIWMFGLATYLFSTIGIPLHYAGIIHIPKGLLPLTWLTLLLWFLVRGYSIGKIMGLKHSLIGMCLSYITVTLNFLYHVVGIVKGDPKKFEVIKKIV
jgi:hypothetical protein